MCQTKQLYKKAVNIGIIITYLRALKNGDFVHVIFKFAEKVLLPSFLIYLGQLQLLIGLQIDLFGVSPRNVEHSQINALPEGHLPNENIADKVVAMLLYSI